MEPDNSAPKNVKLVSHPQSGVQLEAASDDPNDGYTVVDPSGTPPSQFFTTLGLAVNHLHQVIELAWRKHMKGSGYPAQGFSAESVDLILKDHFTGLELVQLNDRFFLADPEEQSDDENYFDDLSDALRRFDERINPPSRRNKNKHSI